MQDERIKLVPPSLHYTDSMFKAINASKSELSTFLPWATSLLSKDDLKGNIQWAANNFEKFSDEFWFNIVEINTEEFIGAVGFLIRDIAVPYYEIGYWLSTNQVGKGYITSAVKLVERYAFLEQSAKRVEIKMASSNSKSQAVATPCGYQFEARLANARRLPSGELDDTLIYVKTDL
ncbi:GNAT family N-acetyltransferase [Vibrio palustris]|uniref:Ribosomal-protein-serine acetyltransferase n=1 Tax=Vibrio palustris TaxID=1918946 RepID=A0A1R4B4V4_9VIBR|nr:GNAT family protein [Vibrio palustris]SJL83944.1 Ribosomal-protein-serine acetyltransferase [Vibrio palustris]